MNSGHKCWQLFKIFLYIGASFFGGGVAIVPFVSEKCRELKIVNDKQIERGLALSQILPGATVIQYSTIIGWMYAGLPGSLAAFAGMALPGVAAMLILSALYVKFNSLTIIQVVLNSLEAVIVVILLQATNKMYKVGVDCKRSMFLALLGFLLFVFNIGSEQVLGICALLAILLFRNIDSNSNKQEYSDKSRVLLLRNGVIAAILLVSIGVLLYLLKPIWGEIAGDMTKVSLLAFGGGYAAAALFFSQAVVERQWLTYSQYMAGLMIGQVTPGPVVITATFIGYIAAGLLGGLIASFFILLPAVVLVWLVEPFFSIIACNCYVQRAIKGLTAMFVGMLLSVAWQMGHSIQWDVAPMVSGVIALVWMIWRQPPIILLIVQSVIVALAVYFWRLF